MHFIAKVPNRAVDVDSRALLACYPRGNFCPMIFRGSTNFIHLNLVKQKSDEYTIGSLSSGFPTARHVRLAVKPAYGFAL